jgi:pimeloyl-ACP methyl ester carboxylesterase
MAYAAERPQEVAGLVLLDSMTPQQFTRLPDFPRVYDLTRRLYGVAPTLTRIGAGQLVRALSTPDLPDQAGEQALAIAASPREWRTTRDEHSVYRRALAQAGELTTLGDKPLVVVSTTHSLEGTSGWEAAQAELSALSGNSTSRIVDSPHADLIIAEGAAMRSADAVLDAVDSVRTGAPLTPGPTS